MQNRISLEILNGTTIKSIFSNFAHENYQFGFGETLTPFMKVPVKYRAHVMHAKNRAYSLFFLSFLLSIFIIQPAFLQVLVHEEICCNLHIDMQYWYPKSSVVDIRARRNFFFF